MSSSFVTDYPIWDDCPFRAMVPAWIEIRRDSATEQAIFYDPEHDLHAVAAIPVRDDVVYCIWNNIAGAIFDQEYPGQIGPLFHRQAQNAASGNEPSEQDVKMFARLRELSHPDRTRPVH